MKPLDNNWARHQRQHISFLGRLLKVMWVGSCSSPTNASHVWSQEMGSSGYTPCIARSLSCDHPSRFPRDFLGPGFYLALKCPSFLLSLSELSPFTPNLVFHFPIPTYFKPIHKISFMSPSQGDLCVPAWAFLVNLGSLVMWTLTWVSFTLQLISLLSK